MNRAIVNRAKPRIFNVVYQFMQARHVIFQFSTQSLPTQIAQMLYSDVTLKHCILYFERTFPINHGQDIPQEHQHKKRNQKNQEDAARRLYSSIYPRFNCTKQFPVTEFHENYVINYRDEVNDLYLSARESLQYLDILFGDDALILYNEIIRNV